MRELFLAGHAVGPEGAASLAASRTLTSLVELDLSDNAIGNAGAAALAASPNLPI